MIDIINSVLRKAGDHMLGNREVLKTTANPLKVSNTRSR